MSSQPRIWAFGISKLRDLYRDVAAQYHGVAAFRIVARGYEEAVQAIENSGAERPDVVISAGSNGAYLKARIDVPVVLVTPTGFDVMHALARASRVGSPLGLIMHGEIPTEMPRFFKSFEIPVLCGSYVSAQDAETCVLDLRERGVQAVIGPGLITEIAEQAGLRSFFLYSRASVRTAIDTALDVARATQAETARRQRSVRPRPAATHLMARYRVADLVGECGSMQRIREQVRRFGRTEATVLLRGESGTGKELAAQAIHNGSARQTFPFVALNCGAFPETLLESELFGYEDGAFTGARRGGKMGLIEAANRGTLFLDEVGEMPLPLQSRLLRVLQEREVVRLGSTEPVPVDVRVIAATHSSLTQSVSTGQFRADLFYRLNILNLTLPPLRERRADIAQLASHLLLQADARFTDRAGSVAAIIEPLVDLLTRYDWPGNVRELQNIIARMVVELAETGLARIEPEQLLELAPELGVRVTDVATLKHRRRRTEAETARAMLESFDGDRERTAAALGISKTTLWRKLRGKD
jgi:propionate catabolism operon transcriptional regulator